MSLGLAATGTGALSACGSSTDLEASSTAPVDRSDVDHSLWVSNWPLYIDVSAPNPRRHPTVDAFQRATGIRVRYTEDVNSNEQFFAMVRDALQAGGSTGRDLFVLTDWMAARMIRYGWIQAIEPTAVPNKVNVVDFLAAPSFDPRREYSLPWQAGMTGIAYNADVTASVRDVDSLLTRKELRGRVTVLSEMRDTMGLIMLQQGIDPAQFTGDQWSRAIASLTDAVDSHQIKSVTGNEYARQLARGDIAAAIAWSGDVIQLQYRHPNIKFVVPEAGGMLWADNMLIPAGSQHRSNAEAWMNWYYRPDIAARLAAYVRYICPVVGAQEAMARVDPTLVDQPLIFPSPDQRQQLSIFMALNDDQEQQYAADFAAAQNG